MRESLYLADPSLRIMFDTKFSQLLMPSFNSENMCEHLLKSLLPDEQLDLENEMNSYMDHSSAFDSDGIAQLKSHHNDLPIISSLLQQKISNHIIPNEGRFLRTKFFSNSAPSNVSQVKYREPQTPKQLNKDAVINRSLKASSGFFTKETRFWRFKIDYEVRKTFISYGNILPDGHVAERAEQIRCHRTGTAAKRFVEKFINEKLKAEYIGTVEW